MLPPEFVPQSMYRFDAYDPTVEALNDEERVSILLYLRDVPGVWFGSMLPTLHRVVQQYDGSTLTSGALDYLHDGRIIGTYGNADALGLINEFDATITLARDRGVEWNTLQDFTQAFGPNSVSQMTTGDATNLAIRFSHAFFTLRTRFMEHAIQDDIRLITPESGRERARERTSVGNGIVHKANMETDVAWVNTPHILPNEVTGSCSNTLGLTLAYFEGIYRLTWPEAAAIVYFATEKRADNSPSATGRIFSWIVYFINQFVNWKTTVTWGYNRLPCPPGISRDAARVQAYEENDGLLIEVSSLDRLRDFSKSGYHDG
ncbi:uncharacterized protein F4812DRAFT_157549 [Daldinia caldariorum]|uniref:uncharacterized protein n=1 Tax=Daldinia caldariorum TaxID=326644 RepID=UPI002008057B|nr:uncharacterized protein F4812DRAFT_157549 [Daldinia caldariorum]KAI1464514.1 hypothetical protein F4812DRAFT_157549 [Daldinia caldariorum]